jgi:hypothetical protein
MGGLIFLPEEVAGLSVLFTVLYICKRSINKRMTKKAKLQTHYLLGTEKRGKRLEAQQIIKVTDERNAWQRNRAPRTVQRKLLWPLSLPLALSPLSALPPCCLAGGLSAHCFGDWAACRSRHAMHYCAMMAPFLAHTPTHLISL